MFLTAHFWVVFHDIVEEPLISVAVDFGVDYDAWGPENQNPRPE